MSLRLQRIIRCRGALDGNGAGFDFKRLLGVWGQLHHASYSQRGGHISLGYFFKIIYEFLFVYYLHGLEKGTVVQLDEAELVGISVVPDPALNQHLAAGIFCGVTKKLSEQ